MKNFNEVLLRIIDKLKCLLDGLLEFLEPTHPITVFVSKLLDIFIVKYQRNQYYKFSKNTLVN